MYKVVPVRYDISMSNQAANFRRDESNRGPVSCHGKNNEEQRDHSARQAAEWHPLVRGVRAHFWNAVRMQHDQTEVL